MPANPCLLPIDADALIQIFCTRFHTPLACLQQLYGVQPCVVPEVDAEIRSNRRRPVAVAGYEKACVKGLVKVLSRDVLRDHKDALGSLLLNVGTDDLWNRIQTRGRSYNRFVDLGESYTHAAGVELSVPIVSNDMNAYSVLKKQRLSLPSATLRSFDLIAFAVQVGAMSEQDADKARGRLREAGESLPRAFVNASFADGLNDFRPRISDTLQKPYNCETVDIRLTLVPTETLGTEVVEGAAATDEVVD